MHAMDMHYTYKEHAHAFYAYALHSIVQTFGVLVGRGAAATVRAAATEAERRRVARATLTYMLAVDALSAAAREEVGSLKMLECFGF